MEKTITIENNSTLKGHIFVSAVVLYRSSLGSTSVYLAILMLLIWILCGFKYSNFFITVMVLASLPWLFFAFQTMIRYLERDNISHSNYLIVFAANHFKQQIIKDKVDFSWVISRDAITDLVYLKNYILIITSQNVSFQIKHSSIPEDKRSLLMEYLEASVEPSENAACILKFINNK
jgi:hypothetical protein